LDLCTPAAAATVLDLLPPVTSSLLIAEFKLDLRFSLDFIHLNYVIFPKCLTEFNHFFEILGSQFGGVGVDMLRQMAAEQCRCHRNFHIGAVAGHSFGGTVEML
jgi:hypothetical protein